MNISLRPATPDDEVFVRQLVIAAIAAELAAWAWPEQMRDSLLDLQYKVRQQGIAGNYPSADSSIVLREDQPVGRTVVMRSEQEIHLVDIAVMAEHQSVGIGTAVFAKLFEESDLTCRPVRLNVNVTNRAVRLYERIGFQRVGGDEVQHFMERASLLK
jgi:ribosomal protein S18 acetylase RimI-like enzyme